MKNDSTSCIKNGPPILVEYKDKKTRYCFHLSMTSNWGNPWDHNLDESTFEKAFGRWMVPGENLDKEFFMGELPEEATKKFRKWLWGEDFKNVLQRRRKWLLLNIKYLKGKKIAYDYKPYAEVLCEAIDKDIELPDIEIIPSKESIKNNKSKHKVKSIF